MIISVFNFHGMSNISNKLYSITPFKIRPFEVYQEPDLRSFRYAGPGYLGAPPRLLNNGLTEELVRYLMFKKL